MERQYVTINEESARIAHSLMSMSDYQEGSKTASYRAQVNEAYDLAEKVIKKRGERFEKRARILADRYARNLGKYYNEDARIGCMCPSVLISGAANFPVRKKERQVAAWDKNQEYYKYCDKILSQLKRLMTCSEVIKCDDENAIEALKEKIEAKEESQERMKEVNKYWRKNGTMTGCGFLTDEQIEKINRSMAEDTWRLSGVPFGSYHLQNNLANIKRLKGRLEELQNTKEKGSSEADYGEFKVIENTDIMRIQIMFDGKPEEAVRNVLKANGFRWAPSQEAWQRQLTTNGKYALKRVLESLQTEKEGA